MCRRIQITTTSGRKLLRLSIKSIVSSLLDQMSNERAIFGRQQKKEREEFRRYIWKFVLVKESCLGLELTSKIELTQTICGILDMSVIIIIISDTLL